MVRTNNGKLSTVIRRPQLRVKDFTKTLDSILEDHSTLSPLWVVEEPLKLLEEETSSSSGRSGTKFLSNSTLTMVPRLSSLSNTKIDLLISKTLESQETCRSGQPMEDGSKCSSSRETIL